MNARQEKWDRRFLSLASEVSSWSQDPSTKVGSVIATEDYRILSLGFNGFPRGVKDTADRYSDKSIKLKLVCHAERNALDNAHFDVTGATIYSTLFPCNECAKSIIQRGIKRVVSNLMDITESRFNWSESLIMFEEAGIEVQLYTNATP